MIALMLLQFNLWKTLKSLLQEIRNKKMEGIAIRSKVKWLQDGEKVSYYFCNLENHNFTNKSMTFFERKNGETTYDQTEMLTEVREFNERLYAHKDCKDTNLTVLLPDFPTLSGEDSELIEGNTTYAEALAALNKMKNNKSPGRGDFSAEFYQFFFVDIWHLPDTFR